jgi:hypothetical protein
MLTNKTHQTQCNKSQIIGHNSYTGSTPTCFGIKVPSAGILITGNEATLEPKHFELALTRIVFHELHFILFYLRYFVGYYI